VGGNDNEFYPLLVKKKKTERIEVVTKYFWSLGTLIVHRVWVKGLIG
jgi:hypothetical protein